MITWHTIQDVLRSHDCEEANIRYSRTHGQTVSVYRTHASGVPDERTVAAQRELESLLAQTPGS